VILEITEGVFLSNIGETREVLDKLVAMGVGLSMDDFGKGYSSLSYLREHPFSNLKIDQFFIQGMETSPTDLALVQASIGMARALNLKVVAEGVETAKQLSMLTALGVDYVQGYLLAHPMPITDYQKFMR
jgi:EAL domain-containing protein (putative c-di-GMP-specific phosphodiesterase class I)